MDRKKKFRPLARFGLPPPGEILKKAQCHERILQHVSSLAMTALTYSIMLHTLPHKIFDN